MSAEIRERRRKIADAIFRSNHDSNDENEVEKIKKEKLKRRMKSN